MEKKMQSDHHEELMTGYVLNTLSGEEKLYFEGLLQKNPSWKQEIDDLQAVMGIVAQAVPTVKAPVSLKNKILAEAQSQLPTATQTPSPSQQTSVVENFSRGKSLFPRWEKLLWAVGVAFIALMGLQNHFLLQEVLEYSEHHDEPTTFAFSLQGETVSKAQGEVVLDLETGRALFAMQNLPALPSDQIYALWAFTEEQPVLCGTFSVPTSGQIVSQIAIPLDAYDESKVVKMQLMRVPATMPADLQKSLPVLTSQI